MDTVLVLEDHPDTRDWLAALAAEAFPGCTTTPVAALAAAREACAHQHFDLALVDISLPDGSGIDLIAELATTDPNTCCVVTSIYDDDRNVFAALRAGAGGYLVKDQPRTRLVEHLQGIASDEPPLSPGVARRILRHFSVDADDDAASPGGGEGLTPREIEVLQLLARGFNRSDIGRALSITPNTAAGYIKSIYRKLDVSGRAEATLAAVERGLVDPKG